MKKEIKETLEKFLSPWKIQAEERKRRKKLDEELRKMK